MSFLPSSPKILKGAFVAFDPEADSHNKRNCITFQYNPERIYRKLESRMTRTARSSSWWNKVLKKHSTTKSPCETIMFTLILDATDDLEDPSQHQNTVTNGICPLLSAIEMLLYPPANKRSITLLVLGNKRVLPVHITELFIVEEMFDTALNPIRATIRVKLRVLNDLDFPRTHKGYEFWERYLDYQNIMADIARSKVPEEVPIS